jgi:MFS family permease
MSGMPRVFWWLWSGALISSLATFVFPFLALYLTARGFDAQRTGLLVSLLGLGSIAAGPLAGTIADRFGRRPAVLSALVGSALAAAFLGFVREPLLIAPGVFVFGVSAAMMYPAVNATVADILPAADVQRGYSLLYWANNLGIGISALVGGIFASRSWLGLFLCDAATTLLFAAIVWRRVPESRPAPSPHLAPRGWRTLLSDRALVGFLAAQFAFLLVFWQFQFALPIAMARDGLGTAAYGRLVAVNCVLILVVQPFATRFVQRFEEGYALAVASIFLGAGYGAYAFCTTATQYFLATLVWSVGEVTGLPPASALVAKLAPEDLRGRYQGAFSFCLSVAMTLAPILGGAVIDRAGMRALWAVCLGLGLTASLSHLALAASRRARAAAQA